MPLPAARYLAIPPYYVKAFNGLRWSENGELIETASGNAFAWREQIWPVLEGFVSVRPPLHFAHILHLMQLLGFGPISDTSAAAAELRRSFLLAGKPSRNAGVLCAEICRDLPGTSVQVSAEELRAELRHRSPAEDVEAEMPLVGPEAFLQKVFASLRKYSADDLVHWLKFGCAPSSKPAERVAEELEKRPPNLAEVLADAARDRERLAGALALV